MAILDFLNIGMKIIDKVIPDPAAKLQAQQNLLQMQQNGQLAELNADLQIALGQIEINKVEAASKSFFKSGWRPAVGWVCVTALAYEFFIRLIAGYILGNWLKWMPPPELETQDLLTLLFSILGLGTMRMTEKLKGKHK